jgi:hypothetical protein
VSKLLNPDFTSLIENYDILVFQETKTDEFDQLLLPKDYRSMYARCPLSKVLHYRY